MDAVTPEARKFLFICGVARSGTTAMMTLLNSHPQIVLGVERYKNTKPGELAEQLFTKERFFDIRPGDTNLRYPEIYEKLEEKFSHARWVGDKVPRYYMRYAELFEKFPGCIVLFMLRDVRAVASSWNVRAAKERTVANPEDNWDKDRGYKKAVEEWNLSLHQTLAFKKQFMDRLIVVEYERLFSGNLALFRQIIGKLELELPQALIREFGSTTRNWETRSRQELLEYEGQLEYIHANADMRAYTKLRKLAEAEPGHIADAALATANLAGAIRSSVAWARSLLRSVS